MLKKRCKDTIKSDTMDKKIEKKSLRFRSDFFFDSILAISVNRLGVLFCLAEFLNVDSLLQSFTFDN